MQNAVILYIFNFLGVAKYEVQWHGKAMKNQRKPRQIISNKSIIQKE